MREPHALDLEDEVLTALDSLIADLEKNVEASEVAIESARVTQALRRQGLTYSDIVDETGRPLVVELITQNMARLQTSGAALRQAHAAVLHEEGLTMERIAELFGVTRQRISTLLQRDGDRGRG